MLAEKLKMKHLSSGEALRETARSKSALGRYLKRQLATGVLTPIPKLMEVFGQYIKKLPASQGIIFDGFARQITETRLLLRKLKTLGHTLDAVVLIDISKTETVKRLSIRGQCDKCNHPFVLGPRLKLGGKCPLCGGKIFQREDDKPAAIRKRLALYHRRTLPVTRYFNSLGLLQKINGQQSVAKVHANIVKALKKRKLIR